MQIFQVSKYVYKVQPSKTGEFVNNWLGSKTIEKGQLLKAAFLFQNRK